MVNLAPIDKIIILGYFILIFVVGALSRKKKDNSAEEFILAGRRVTLPAFVATMVATWYGGILGVGEFTYKYGIVNWVTQGLFYYLFAVIFALFFSKKIRALKIFTIPDHLEQVYGRKTAIAGSVFTFIMVSPASYLLILGVLFQMVFGWSLLLSIIVGALLSTFYILLGGFRAVVRTDIIQFVLMFFGFLIIVPAAVSKLGGISYLKANLPETHLTFTGELGTMHIIVWGLIAFWTFVDPGFYQRCLAAKNGDTAKKGILISVIFWFFFDLLTCTAGLYGRAFLTNIDPLMTYPVLADSLLPSVLKGIFFTGMLATVMSTLDSTSLLSAITLGNDVAARIRGFKDDSARVTLYIRAGLVITITGGIILAYYFRSVIDIWYTLGTIGIPALLIPMVSSFSQRLRLSPGMAFVSILSSAGLSIFWIIYGMLNTVDGFPVYILGIEPIYPGLLLSLALFYVSYLKKSKI